MTEAAYDPRNARIFRVPRQALNDAENLLIAISRQPEILERLGWYGDPRMVETARRLISDAIAESDRRESSGDDLATFRDKLAALAAIENHLGGSAHDAARDMRDLLAGTGDDDNDPRVRARRYGLEW